MGFNLAFKGLNKPECCEFPLLSQAAKTSKRKLFLYAVKIISAMWLNIVWRLEFVSDT
jgi:glutamyl/glutaminyl-tRNA synthetase